MGPKDDRPDGHGSDSSQKNSAGHATKLTSHSAKTLTFFVAVSAPRGSSLRSSKTLLFFSEMQSSRIVPLASAPAGCAAPYSTTRDHCGALRTLSRNISKSALNVALTLTRASPLRRLCLPFSSRTDSDFVLWECDHLRRPRCALGRSDPALPLGKPNPALRVRRSSLIKAHRKSIYGTRVNLISIVRLAARRKGIARSAALHLDCARFARKTGTYRFTPSIFQ